MRALAALIERTGKNGDRYGVVRCWHWAAMEASCVEIKALRGDVMAEIKLLKWMGEVLLAFQVVVMGKLFLGQRSSGNLPKNLWTILINGPA